MERHTEKERENADSTHSRSSGIRAEELNKAAVADAGDRYILQKERNGRLVHYLCVCVYPSVCIAKTII